MIFYQAQYQLAMIFHDSQQEKRFNASMIQHWKTRLGRGPHIFFFFLVFFGWHEKNVNFDNYFDLNHQKCK